jgi:predicted MFS family arabinose efflux permease
MGESSTSTRMLRSLRSPTFAALGESGFRRFYIGQGISLVGSWLQAAAVRWLVFEQTRSEFMLGVIEVASLLPGLFVGLYAGALADRVRPLRMLLAMECAQMILAFALAALVGLNVVHIWQMAAILALARICVTFELPSRQVLFFELVGPETLSNAIALNSGLFNATRVLGPALAGVCLSMLGATGCFALNGVSFMAAIAAILSIRLKPRPRTHHDEPLGVGAILGGLRHLHVDRRLLLQFLLVAYFGVIGMGYEAMIPSFAARVVHTDVGGYSVLLACGGIGATVGALVVASLGGVRRKERLSLVGMLIFGASLACASLIPVALPPDTPNSITLACAAACILAAGFGAVTFYSSSMMRVQTGAPDHLRGRMMGIWMIVYSGSVPLGALWTGKAAESWGVALVMGVSALICIVTALLLLASRALEGQHPDAPAEKTSQATVEKLLDWED